MIKAKWTAPEDKTVCDHYPDYDQMRAALPHRTYFALRQRARHLGAASTRHTWTGRDMVKLKSMWLGATKAALLKAFPGRSFGAIKSAAKGAGLGPRGLVRRGCDPYREAINARARERGISNRDLDRLLQSGSYFEKAQMDFRPAHVFRAAELLDFEINIRWEPLE